MFFAASEILSPKGDTGGSVIPLMLMLLCFAAEKVLASLIPQSKS